jgi:hypothetical protein
MAVIAIASLQSLVIDLQHRLNFQIAQQGPPLVVGD